MATGLACGMRYILIEAFFVSVYGLFYIGMWLIPFGEHPPRENP